jgi:uncharacterized protein
MKASTRTFLLTVLGLFILGGGVVFQRVTAQASERSQLQDETIQRQRTVSVNGQGQSSVAPDMAVLRIGVQNQAGSAAEALEQNNEQMSALLGSLRAGGVAAGDIQTQFVQLFPVYQGGRDPSDQPTLVGYRANNLVEVRVRNLEQVGDLIDTAVGAGANQIESIRFEVSNRGRVMDQARQAAVEDARRKAEQLASLTGTDLGPVLSIEEVSFRPFIPEGVMADRALAPIEPGVQSVEVEVRVIWLLE